MKHWLCGFSLLFLAVVVKANAGPLEDGFEAPPPEARLRAYWWWINGNVTKEAITHDLEEMKAKGWGGAIICDADGSDQDDNDRVPHGPTFFSPQWRELYKYTLREANRLGLEMSLNIQSGWNLGGPMVTADDAPKKLAWTETSLIGGTNVSIKLDKPAARENYYRDLFVLAYRVNPKLPAYRKPIQNQPEKALIRALQPYSAPVSTRLFQEYPSVPDEQDAKVSDVMDISKYLDTQGELNWDAPPGEWRVLRFGCTLNDNCRVSTCSEGWDGYAIDPFDAGAFSRYWNTVVEPLISDAGSLAGTTLKYLHTDSWEVEVANWTPTLREEFWKRRGYDLLPWLPAIAGKIVNSREETDRFLADFRKTMGDLAIDNHFKLFKEGAHKHGMLIHPESGGPHAVPIDAQRCLGFDDAPMSEFWAWSWTHRIGDQNRFFVKQPASAAHTYGHNLVLAEGFTTIGPHWQETLWDNLKPAFDHACTEGVNRLVWHAFVCSPKEMGMPGQQYFAGTHMNPNVTWWEKSGPFIQYLNRCQFMMQQGLFVADALYYYGDHVPNFAQLRSSDPARVGNGYDYDVITEEAILTRLSVHDGLLTLPDGMNYRVLVLPDRKIVSLAVLQKIQKLIADGATVIMPRPETASGLTGYPECDGTVKQIAAQIFGEMGSSSVIDQRVGKGRIITGKTAREVLVADGVGPDFEYSGASGEINYIHRRSDGADIYFIASRSTNAESLKCAFRISGKTPEIWDAVSGEHHFATAYVSEANRTTLPLDLPPCGSDFIVFRDASAKHPAHGTSNSAAFITVQNLGGPWEVTFDPASRGPGKVAFDSLESWTDRSEPEIKYYSGTAVYRKNFELPPKPNTGSRIFLDLGNVRELAEVKLNGKSCGVAWAPPFRVEISPALVPGTNQLEIEVVNFWPNRLIGDAAIPAEQRPTKTNIRKLTPQTPLIESGLFGPVTVMQRQIGD